MMAAKESKLNSAVTIKKLVETTTEGKEIFSTQRFSKVKAEVSTQDIYDVVSAMGNVFIYPIANIIRQDNKEIVNE